MKKTALVFLAFFAAVFFSSCSIKPADTYTAGKFTFVSLSAVCGGVKLNSVTHISETDEVRSLIYTNAVRYDYDNITAEDLEKYKERLVKEGFHEFSPSCYQTSPDKEGCFAEVIFNGNSVTVAMGKIN